MKVKTAVASERDKKKPWDNKGFAAICDESFKNNLSAVFGRKEFKLKFPATPWKKKKVLSAHKPCHLSTTFVKYQFQNYENL